jgi:uncharacterized protein YihD (DUF1040 family)
MTLERLEEIFEETQSKWEGDNAFQGLQILAKYTEKNVICAAEHDIIYSINAEDVIEILSEEDAIKLAQLNWMLEDEYFACYV